MRALTPHIGAYLELAGGERLGVRDGARAVDAARRAGQGEGRVGRAPGRLRATGRCASTSSSPPGGKPMPADAYLRGHQLPKLA